MSMKYPQTLTLCGFGGQGIVLSSVILGTTAVTKHDLYAVQTQSYGSEARGGQCQSELIIDEKPINSPVAQKKDLIVALFQDAYNKYIPTLKAGGALVIDPDLVTDRHDDAGQVFPVPFTKIATDLGNRMATNMVMLGFLSECFGIVNKDELMEVIADSVSARFYELNKKAVEAGVEFARAHNMRYVENGGEGA